MQGPFKLDVYKCQEKRSFISKGFLKCVVKATTSPFPSRQFAYFLHCRQLRSISWFFEHKRKVGFMPTPQQVLFFDAKFEDYFQDIMTEVELLSETGRLFLEGRQSMQRDLSCGQLHEETFDLPGESEEGRLPFIENEAEELSGHPLVFDEDDGDIQENDTCLQAERMVECISECFEDCCLLTRHSI